MKVGIDARMYGPSVGGGGLGRYVEQLIKELAKKETENRYLLFLKKENIDLVPKCFEKRLADIHWYSWREQLQLPKIINQEKLDLVHFPHWNVPIRLKTPFVVTIHDLILIEQPRSARATTKHPLTYWLKHQAFRATLHHALTKSRAIIAVSNYTRNSILHHFPEVNPDKIHVVYEGLTRLPSPPKESLSPIIPTPYFLYIGNAYPHKNLEALLHAFSFFHKRYPSVHLVLAGRDDLFYQRLKKELGEIDIPDDAVTFIMNPTDEQIASLYQKATLYLFPSLSEGFGLPPLEAMSFGTPVAASNTSSLPEILGDAAIYFPPDDIERMVEIMIQVIEQESLIQPLIAKGYEQIKRYSWPQMATEIQSIYESCV
jgi:glycosyltransferase involved in cell wall biosynthesis